MNRRSFLASLSALPVVAACSSPCAKTKAVCSRKDVPLRLCLQYVGVPVRDDINARLDYLEANGFSAVEIPTGRVGEWLLKNAEDFRKAMQGRHLTVATACGPSNFSYADPAKREAEVQKFLPLLEILGELKSTGLILCPARKEPELSLPELRADFVTNTGRRLAQKAVACGTAIVLEPLQRAETPFLRQVSDAARMAMEIGPGAKVMGDFWHMSKEEPNFYGPFLCAGDLLVHVHIASLVNRRYPGSDGAADNYVEGFRALKQLSYKGVVSMEAGAPQIGKDAKGKPIYPDMAGRHALIMKMVNLLKEQWEQA